MIDLVMIYGFVFVECVFHSFISVSSLVLRECGAVCCLWGKSSGILIGIVTGGFM